MSFQPQSHLQTQSSPSPSPPKTLQALASSKAIKDLLASPSTTTSFFALEDHQQHLIFTHLIHEHNHLLRDKEQQAYRERMTPWLDRELYSRRHPRLRTEDQLEETEYENREDDSPDPGLGASPKPACQISPYTIRSRFLARWSYATSTDLESAQSRATFSRRRLLPHFDTTSLIVHGETASGLLTYCPDWEKCGFAVEEHHALYERVSSQLLLYRVCSMFGTMPRKETDGYKNAWWGTLVLVPGGSTEAERQGSADEEVNVAVEGRDKDDEDEDECDEQPRDFKAILHLGDWKGSPTANCQASDEESLQEALALLGFLTTVNMPHTYDGIVCGTQA